MNSANNKQQSSHPFSSSSSSVDSCAKQQKQVAAVTAPAPAPSAGSSSACRSRAVPPCPSAAAAERERDAGETVPALLRPNSALNGCFSPSRPSCASSSASRYFSSPTFQFVCVAVLSLLLCCAASTSSGRVMGHHHHHHHTHQQHSQQQLLDLATDDAPVSEMISMLNGDLFLAPSSLRKTEVDDAKNVCAKSSDREATIVRSLSKTTGQTVLLLPQQRFKVSYCEQQSSAGGSAETGQCAVGSNCATVYRWAKALVKPPESVEQQLLNLGASEFEFADDVLVPMDCLCVLRWAQIFRGKGPIIFG